MERADELAPFELSPVKRLAAALTLDGHARDAAERDRWLDICGLLDMAPLVELQRSRERLP